MLFLWIIILWVREWVLCGLSLHFPRGSNNRCDENDNSVYNPSRLFRSNNEPSGGYGPCPEMMAFYEDTDMNIALSLLPRWYRDFYLLFIFFMNE